MASLCRLSSFPSPFWKFVPMVSSSRCASSVTGAQSAQTTNYVDRLKSIDTLPGPGIIPWLPTPVNKITQSIAVMFQDIKKNHEVIVENAKKYGKIHRTNAFGFDVVSLSDPQLIERFCRTEDKYPMRFPIEPWLDYRKQNKKPLGILLEEGKKWHKSRSAMSRRLLRPPEIGRFLDAMNGVAADVLERLKTLRPKEGPNKNIMPNFEEELFRWAFESACTVFFDKRLGILDKNSPKIHPEIDEFVYAFQNVLETTANLMFKNYNLQKMLRTKTYKTHTESWDLLFRVWEPWVKKASSNLFDVTMGSYDGAETCELDGSFLLNQITGKHGNTFGLSRDDGLGIINATPRQIENTKKDLCAIFNKHGLKITIEANKKIVNFLDITLNLESGKYMPYTKLNNTPLYVHNKSNHPPGILKNIPESINKRLSEISFDEESFNKAAPLYQQTLRQKWIQSSAKVLHSATNKGRRQHQETSYQKHNLTSYSVLWALYCILRNPECQERLYEEVTRVIPEGVAPTKDHFNETKYLRAVIPETQRYSISRSSEYFEDPYGFNPERWLSRVKGEKLNNFLMLLFGFGICSCIGMVKSGTKVDPL
ncbi:1,25-dihydroxyvitamin D(3) 24-hydroxylase, mitochondrial-like [Anneissia japonica]|uniref:1,25-dihydroxyvitamin D(3) 24-hydroxylase, mitochondrial-like n=1 Tax=Anneissia japonica TaxID=1529436 RepID=UPI001425523F|nr:1,25-dihydroxyvitamin D(3) 24-hydroxylase, mitochondrial-like [Anneissia japonica]